MGNTQQGSKNTKTLEHLILMGDSFLDDFYGCSDHKNDVEHQLVETFSKNYIDNKVSIVNLALEESTVDDILNGKKPNDSHIAMRKEMGLSDYQIDVKDGKLYPLKLLTNLIQTDTILVPPTKEDLSESRFMLGKSPKSSMNNKNDKSEDAKSSNSNINRKDYKSIMRPIVVLSVGGSDIRNHLSYGQFDLIIKALEEKFLKENIEKVVKFLTKNLHLDVVLVLCSEPHESFFESQLHFCRDDLVLLMDWFAKQLFKIAENYSIPVLDLSRTMNPFDSSHYGNISTQPSNKAGQFIVDLIVHILQNFDFESNNRKSMIFYGTREHNGIVNEVCDKSARSSYLRALNRIIASNPMAFNEMDLLDDLFSEPMDSKSNETVEEPSPVKRKRSLFGKTKVVKEDKSEKDKSKTQFSSSNSDMSSKFRDKEDDMLLDQMINEHQLDENLKFFSNDKNKNGNDSKENEFATETRTRNKHSLFDTENDQKLKTYNYDNSNDGNTTMMTTATENNNETINSNNDNTNETETETKNDATNSNNNNNNNSNNSDEMNASELNITRDRAIAEETDPNITRSRALADDSQAHAIAKNENENNNNESSNDKNPQNTEATETETTTQMSDGTNEQWSDVGTRNRMGYNPSDNYD